MSAQLAEHLEQRTVKVAQLRFGKLVLEPLGPVHFDAGYAVTFKTPDFVGNGKCLPDALIGGVQLTEAHVESGFSRDGGLLLRLVHLDSGDRVIAMRARLRPEAGEGHAGRSHVQATVLQTVTGDGWSGMPAGFPAWCADGLFAVPDVFSTTLAERLPCPPLELEPDSTPVPTLSELAALPGRKRARIATMARTMMEGAPLVIGSDAFGPNEPGPEDTAARTKIFFADVGKVFSLLAAEDVAVAPGLVIAAGFTPAILPGAIRLVVSLRSSPVLDEDTSALEAALAGRSPKRRPRPVAAVLPHGASPNAVPSPVHAQRADIELKYRNPAVASTARPGTRISERIGPSPAGQSSARK